MKSSGYDTTNLDPAENGPLKDIPKTNPFVAPQGYFETPLTRVQLLCTAPFQSPFAAPKGYFEALPSRLSQLTLLEKTDWAAAPESYFLQLPASLEQRLRPAEQVPFTAPDAYFDSLAIRVQQRMQDSQKGRLIRMQPLRTLQPVLVAASVVLLLAVGMIYFLKNTDANQTVAAKKQKPVEKAALHPEILEVAQIDEATLSDVAASAQADLELHAHTAPSDQPIAAEHHAVSDYLMQNNIDENELTEMIGG